MVLLFFSSSLQRNGREGAWLWLGGVSNGCGPPTMGQHGLLGFPGLRGLEVGSSLLEGRSCPLLHLLSCSQAASRGRF